MSVCSGSLRLCLHFTVALTRAPAFRAVLVAGALIGAGTPALAQPAAGTGTISGRVLNPATGEYVRNADVQITGGDATASEEGGRYRLSAVPAGPVELVVTYTGYQPIRATVQVVAGEIVTRDFELVSSLEAPTAPGGSPVLHLDKLVVASGRAGNAKAIMDQRKSMNITNSVASDAFGDIAEGNIGEFVKNLPGVDTDSMDGTARYVRLRGMPSAYTSVTVNGVGLASADANAPSRAFSFEQVSLSSIESIEIAKTVSADVDANAPAGTINLKTKRAFDRNGRRVALQTSLSAQSDQFTFDRTYGPGDDLKRKVLPSAKLEYSDIFLKGRLGVIFSLSESNSYIQRELMQMGWNYVPTATNPAPVALAAVRAIHIGQTVERTAAMLTVDFKANDSLTLSLTSMYNFADIWSGQRNWLFTTGDRAVPVAGDPTLNFITMHASPRVNTQAEAVAKQGEGMTFVPSLEYRKGDFTLEARVSRSTSTSNYDPMDFRGSFYRMNAQVSGVKFSGQRSDRVSGDWTFKQLSGADWADGASYTPVSSEGKHLSDDGRGAENDIASGELIASLKTSAWRPIAWKAGVKGKREAFDYENTTPASQYDYRGPGPAAAGVGSLVNYASPVPVDFSDNGAHAISSSGRDGGLLVPNLLQFGQLFREHPEYFVQSFTADNYYSAYIENARHFEENIDAAFFMGTATLARGLTARAGVRWEQTTTKAREPNPLTPSEVRAAGYPVSPTTNRATTIPGLQYQYESQPQIEREGSYDNFFPSASVKWEPRKDLQLQLGYSHTIRRPEITSLAGVWSVSEATMTVTAPNPSLKPEMSDNLSLRLAKYFEPVGIVAVNLYQNSVKGLFQTVEMSAEEFGYEGDVYQDYRFRTTNTLDGQAIQVRGMELEYSQALSFLPAPFNGLSVRAAYSRNTAETTVEGLAPQLFTGGFDYSFKNFSFTTSVNWADDTALTSSGVYRRHRVQVDAGGNYRFYRKWQVFCTLRNLSDAPYIEMTSRPGTAIPDLSSRWQKYGVTTTLGVRTAF